MMPMVKRTYSITETLDDYVKQRFAAGEYATDSEYLRELIRRDRDENKDIAFISSKLIEAEQSGFSAKSRDKLRSEFKARARKEGKLKDEKSKSKTKEKKL